MDAGGEFALVKKLCTEKNISTYIPFSSFHGALIERFNQTIKIEFIDGCIVTSQKNSFRIYLKFYMDITNLFILQQVSGIMWLAEIN